VSGWALQLQPSTVATSDGVMVVTYAVATVIASVHPTRPAAPPTAITCLVLPAVSVTGPQWTSSTVSAGAGAAGSVLLAGRGVEFASTVRTAVGAGGGGDAGAA